MIEVMSVSPGQRARRKNVSRPRARRIILWTFVFFILSQLTLGLALTKGSFASRNPDRRDRLQLLHDRMALAPSPPLTVVLLGSSHVETGLRACRMTEQLSSAMPRPVVVTNWGIAGGASIRSLLTMDRLRRDGIRPDLVLIETFPALFSKTSPTNDVNELGLPPETLDAGDVALLRRHNIDRTDLGYSRWLRPFAQVYEQRSNLIDHFYPDLLPVARHRKPPREELFFGDLSPQQKANALRAAKEGYLAHLQALTFADPRQVSALDELVSRLQADGVKVVLLATPEGPLFRSWYAAKAWTQSVTWLREQADRLGVPLVDAREWTNREEWFLDSHHLDDEGATRFSAWLAREVLMPNLQSKR